MKYMQETLELVGAAVTNTPKHTNHSSLNKDVSKEDIGIRMADGGKDTTGVHIEQMLMGQAGRGTTGIQFCVRGPVTTVQWFHC